jgi:hypothetical protein
MFDGKRGRVNDPVRKILQLTTEDHSVDFVRVAGQIVGVGLNGESGAAAAAVARLMTESAG